MADSGSPVFANGQDLVSRNLPSLARSIYCFRATGQPRRSRARFSTEEKEKVLQVRRQGACLRCRILKIQCSAENPCQPCLQSAVRGYERKVLSFCYCVRTRFADVNIFASPLPTGAAPMQTENLMSRMSNLLARLATPASFSLASDPDVFNDTMVSWLTDPDFHLPNGSIVGLCCSSLLGLQFQEESNEADGLITDFQRFMLATSLAHSGWRDGVKTIKSRELCAASQISGSRLIKRLDRILTPQFLARFGRESCQVLFLLVLGVALGVGYSSSQLEDHSPSFPSEMLSPEFQRSPTLWLAMKEHLCQMLAHHLIFVGSLLGIKLETGLEQRIIDTAVRRWNKAESFIWADAEVLSEDQQHACSEKAESSGKAAASDEDRKPQTETEPQSPPRLTSEPPQLVPIAFPEVGQFQTQRFNQWSENPLSYFSMFDEPESFGSSDSGSASQERRERQMRTNSESIPRHHEHVRPPQAKRRSVWIVRPFDAGPEHGILSTHARLRADDGMETLRSFV
ncbi:Zn(2)-C6 fungal-type domain-containing protein [Madurella fahalii]|uniref:Zn(2)-C6 fungal-type domain-containing protein n=1 Tax=Madurella fahalii TaxID=1157608 RepID=A0ABQ0FWF9_9PEZI